MSRSPFTSVSIAGGLLPADLLGKLVEGGGDVPGLDPSAYHLAAGEGVRQAASRKWAYLTGVWTAFKGELDRVRPSATTGITRERWLLILLRELDFGRVPATPSGGLVVGGVVGGGVVGGSGAGEDGRAFPVSHQWGTVPIHLLGWGVDLDHRTRGQAGAAGAAPQSMVQQVLNVSDEHLWAVLSNGRKLRLLRDSTSLVGSAYVEFDLEAMFDGELFSDFVLLFLLAHESRFEVAEEGGPASCWLERWRDVAAERGTRALEQLRDGVEAALTTLGAGFLRHPDNRELRDALASGRLSLIDYHRALLRCAYKLLFWFVAEDRGLLLDPHADGVAGDRYARFFSAARLRERARARRGDHHDDLWRGLRLVFDGLGAEGGLDRLGLPGLGGLFEVGGADEPLEGRTPDGDPRPEARVARAALANEHLLSAVRSLSIVRDRDGGPRRSVDFQHLGAEELGSVYESLLELHPRHDRERGTFSLEAAPGNERKITGSYYTPTSLIQCLLDSALDPLLDEACQASDPVEALLSVTVCDPACGSGHFLVAAAQRIARRLASVESGEVEPTPDAVRSALRRVVARCVHGVDANPLAAELAKVSLWLEALEPGKPLSFLDANIRVGNSLLGVTPALLADGIPADAFKPIEGDAKKVATLLRRRNDKERSGEVDLFTGSGLGESNVALARETSRVTGALPGELAGVHEQEQRFARVEAQRESRKLTADAWCAAFVQEKTAEAEPTAITTEVLRKLAGSTDVSGAAVQRRVGALASEYGFFHWHLEFPHIFRVPESGEVDPDTGWTGGFSCVLGNPPWDKIEMNEKEFFSSREPEIAEAAGARRKQLIEALRDEDPLLYREFLAETRRIAGTSHLLKASGRYELTGRGRLNTYAVFAETDRTIVDAYGRTGVVVPTGIATDATTQYFFRDLVETSSVASLYDFENRKGLFPSVDSRMKFCLLTLTGGAVREASASFAFFAHDVADLEKPDVVFALKPDEITLLNPNTGTLPVFRSRRDAEITLGIYRRVPVLLREGDPDGNPWGVSFMQGLFNMTSDSHLFRTREQLEADGYHLDGNVFTRGAGESAEHMLPLYEAKMIHHYDHRWATYENGSARNVELDEKHDPDFASLPRYWVAEKEADQRLADKWDKDWLLGWRDICRATDERTMIDSVLARDAFPDGTLLMLPSEGPVTGLASCLTSFALDFAARQKVGGTHLKFFTAYQLPVIPPSAYWKATPWQPDIELRDWIADRVLELTYTAWDMARFAADLGDDGAPFVWDGQRRELLRAELDAAYFHLYGIERDDVDYIMETFPIVKRKDEKAHGDYRTKNLTLETYDKMKEATGKGEPYESPVDPLPGLGPRHDRIP